MTDLVDTRIPGRVVMLVSIFVVLCLLQGISCRNIGQREYKRVQNRDSPFQRETETKLDIEHARGCTDCGDSHAVSHGQPTQEAEIDKNIHGPRFSEKDRTRNSNGHKMRRDHLKKNHESKAKSKSREKRLKDADISHQEQKQVANWKSKRRSRRRKNHQQTQPHSKMYASDPRRTSYRQQLPPGVARLESRLHPSISNSINKLNEQLSVVLQKIKRKVNEVNYEYILIGNDTRKDVMVIRKELQKISDENNEVYDAILDTSQLVRYIMLRAHQKGLAAPAPQRMLRGPVLPSRDFRMSMYDVRLQERNSKYLMSRVTDMKRECIQQDSQSASIEQKVNSRLPITALEDLYVISRKVLSKLSGPIRESFTRRRLDRYKDIQNSIDQNLLDARNLSRTAYYDLQYAKRLYQDNMRDGIRIKSERQNRNRRSTSRGDTLEIIREVNEKSTKLQQEAEYIENTITPLLVIAKNKPRDGAYAALMTEVRAIAKRLESLIMKIDRKLDGIRIFIGDESILRKRCEDLIEGSGDDDSTPIDCDEFEIESGSGELEIFSTEKPKLTSSTPPPVIEGSGDGESDFVFVNATDTADNDDSSWYSSLWGDDPNVHNPYRLRDKLMEKASESSERSEKVNKRSEKISLRLEDLRFLKDKLNQREDHLQEYVTNASRLTQNWKDAKFQIDTSKQKIKALDEAFFGRLEEIQNKSKAALIKANAVLAEVKKANENKETKRATEEAKLLSDLISTVSKMKSGSEKLKSIKEISRNSCETVQRSAANLRNNIAQLRQKIVKARQIAQSMPISVVLDGSSHFLIPVPTPKQRESSISTFGICFKPTGDSMPIASFYSNTSLSYTIAMIDRQTKVIVDDPSGNNIDTLQSSYDLELDKWYRLNLNRYGHVLELKTDDKENPENSVVEKKTMLDLQPLQEMPSYVTIGSGATKETFPENFRGCIGQVQVDGRYTGLTGHDSTGKKPLLCKDNCNVDGGSAMVFEGDGYAKFSLEIVYPSFKVQNIILGFRTVQKDGVLFLLNDRLQSLQVLISLTNGSLHVEARTRRGTTVVKSGQNTYANGSLHTIEITLGANEVDVRVVTNNDTFKQELTTQEITSSIDDGIFLGGLGSKSSLVTGKSKLRSIVACISKFAINKKDIPLFLMKESWNVYLGDCSRNIWFECVRFSEGSSPIVFPKSNDTKSIYVSVDRNSMGRILHYKRTDKFDIEILVDGNGIEISNIKTDDSTVIDSSPSYDVHWYQIAIEDQDDNKRLMVTFNGSSTFIPHASGGNWWNGGKKASNYTLTIGGSEFHGGISRLLINDKYVSMTNYRKSNNLGSCEKRASDIIDNKDIDEKPIC